MHEDLKPGDKLVDMALLGGEEPGAVWTVTEVIRHPTQPDEVWVNMERAAIVTQQVRGNLIGRGSRFQPVEVGSE